MVAPIFFGVVFLTRQAPTVSLELRGVRLENAAPILAKAFGWGSLDIGPTLKNEVILVRTKDVDPVVLRQKLAQTLNATWEDRPEGWRLTQSDDQKAAEQKIYKEERYRFFRELTEKSQKRLAQMLPFDETNCKKLVTDLKALSKMTVNNRNNNLWRKISQIDQQSPMNRLAYRIAMRITPEIWMKLSEENPKVVFCTRPTQMQMGFPFQISDLIDKAFQEQNQWATYATGEPLPGPRAGATEFDGYYSLGSMNDHRQPFKVGDFYTFTMTLSLQSQSVYVAAYDRNGKRTIEADVNFYDYPEMDENYNYNEELDKMKKKVVKLEGDALEYANLVAPLDYRDQRRSRKKEISPSLREKLLHPETCDPLSISAPDVYLKSIDEPNVVMVMNDNQHMARFPEFKEPKYSNYYGSVLSKADGWFLYHQPNPVQARKAMPDRKKLGQVLRFIDKNQRPLTLEEQADLAYSLPWENDYSWAFRSYLEPFQTTEVEGYNDRMALRIYGAMTSGEREQARKNGVPLSILNEKAKLEIFRSVFYSDRYESRLEMDWSSMGQGTRDQQKEYNRIQELLWGGIYEEKTFVLPNGLANNLVIKIEETNDSTLYAGRPPLEDGNYYGEGRSLSANELGQYLFKSQNPQRYRWEVESYNKIDENDIRIASRRTLNMKMQTSPLLYFSWNLNQTLITDPKTYTSKTLPAKVLEEIQKAYKEAEEMDKKYGDRMGYGGASTRGNPPPPR